MTDVKVPLKLPAGYATVELAVTDSSGNGDAEGEYLSEQDLLCILKQNVDLDNIPRDVDRMVKHNIEANR